MVGELGVGREWLGSWDCLGSGWGVVGEWLGSGWGVIGARGSHRNKNRSGKDDANKQHDKKSKQTHSSSDKKR